jgi:transcriptional/translational regulatory protein YebC/TACO1
VSWQFSRKGVVIAAGSASEDDVMAAAIDAGADDIVNDGDSWRVTCEPHDVETVRAALEAAGITVDSAEATMVSSTEVPLSTAEDAKKVLRVIDALEDHDDVQNVYSNFDIPDSILETVEA